MKHGKDNDTSILSNVSLEDVDINDCIPQIDPFAEVLHKMYDIHAAKNHDYGQSFSKTLDEFGLIAPAIRLNDKLERFKMFVYKSNKGMKVSDESIKDTLLDLAVYAAMTLAELDNEK